MTVRDFRLLADANIDAAVVSFPRSEGLDVFAVTEQGLGAADDDTIMRLARQQGRVIVTHDRDFGRLAMARCEPMVGIVFVRPGHVEAAFTTASFRALFDAAIEVVPPFLIVVERRGSTVRIRSRQP